MNFQLAKVGQSFKGAFAYYLHDKQREEGGPHLETAERVGWVEVRNLAHDDPAYVQGVMIATARNAEAMKKENGLQAGRKSKGPVYAYSLAWHPENETVPDRAGMLAAVDETLKVLKADHLQAAIIYHTDTAHPHVHVIVNRVNPETGKLEPFGNDAFKLNAWAAKYERERGQIVSPNRAEKYERMREQEATAQRQAFTKAAEPQKAPAPEKPKTPAATLAAEQAVQRARHKQEWADLSAANKERRAAVYGERIDYKAIAANHRAATRGEWSKLGKELAAERRAFHEREKRLSGIVRNAIDTVRGQQIRGVADDRGFLSMCFAYTLNTQARHAALALRQQETKDQLAASLNAALQDRFNAAKAAQTHKLREVRATYDRERAALMARQDLEKAQIRDRWKAIYAEREKLAQATQHSRDRMTRQNGQNYRHGRRLDRATIWRAPIDNSQAKRPAPLPAVQQQEKPPVKAPFGRASSGLAPTNLSPDHGKRVSVATPAPTPAPSGVPTPSPRTVQNTPTPDRAAAWAQSAAGQKATAPQKAAPDSLRRSFSPPAPTAGPAKVAPTNQPQAPMPAKEWGKAATPQPTQQQPLREWKKDAPQQSTAPKTPPRGRFKDDWERDR